MNPIVKNVLAVVAGWIAGGFVNMSLINLGHKLMPIEGLDPNDMTAYAEMMPNLEAQYFIFPFLGHALGTLVGACVAAVLAANHKMKHALGVGVLFLVGGIVVNIILRGPMWFTALDILMAYIPMAWIGGKIGMKF